MEGHRPKFFQVCTKFVGFLRLRRPIYIQLGHQQLAVLLSNRGIKVGQPRAAHDLLPDALPENSLFVLGLIRDARSGLASLDRIEPTT